MILTKDNLRLGLIVGIIAPLFGMLAFYFWKFYPFSLSEFFGVLATNKPVISALLSFSLFANAVVFTLYLNTRRDRTAKGIFIITVIYAVVALVVKFMLR